MALPVQGVRAPKRVVADADYFAALEGLIRMNEEWARGKIGVEEVGRRFWGTVDRFAASAQGMAWSKAPKMPNRIACRVRYHRRGGDFLPMVWWAYPGSQVLTFCPECFLRAPSTAKEKDGQRPVIVDGVLRFARSNPDSERRFVNLQYMSREIWVERGPGGEPLLTLGRTLACDEGCGFRVRVDRGVARWVPNAIVRSGAARPIAGPLVIVR